MSKVDAISKDGECDDSITAKTSARKAIKKPINVTNTALNGSSRTEQPRIDLAMKKLETKARITSTTELTSILNSEQVPDKFEVDVISVASTMLEEYGVVFTENMIRTVKDPIVRSLENNSQTLRITTIRHPYMHLQEQDDMSCWHIPLVPSLVGACILRSELLTGK